MSVIKKMLNTFLWRNLTRIHYKIGHNDTSKGPSLLVFVLCNSVIAEQVKRLVWQQQPYISILLLKHSGHQVQPQPVVSSFTTQIHAFSLGSIWVFPLLRPPAGRKHFLSI